MGSRRRNRAARDPTSPPEASGTSHPEYLVPPERWIYESITPSEKPIVIGTPRHPGLNADQITPKHPGYGKKVDNAMTLRYHSVSVAVFQNELLKGPNLGARRLKQLGNFKQPETPPKESDLYPVLCESLNSVLQLAGSKFVFKDVSHWPESGDIDHRPDLAMYPVHRQAAAAYTLTGNAEAKSKVSESRKPYIARCAYQWMVTAIEVKPDGVETGFGFKPGEPLLRDSAKAVEARAQLATYASEIMLRQHRTHLFLFYIAGSNARIFRWDRNGSVVSHVIDLATNFKLFLNLIYRLARADKSLQGFDTTVSPASGAEVDELRQYKPDNKYLEGYKALMLDNMLQYPIFKVECDEVLLPDGRRRTRASRRKRYLIGKHVSGGYQPVGRCTKAWVCYSLDDDTMAFMKEQWRANAVGVHPEIETYLRLRQHGVERVGTVVAGGDVGDSRGLHKTVSQRFFDKEGINMSERIQTRLVVKEVGRPLESYEHSPELIIALTHALLGHQQAWEKAGVLHRDVSAGNILIDTTSLPGQPLGFLTDWDLSKYKDELEIQTGPSQTGVSGTWAFGSALSLQYPRKPKELADDIESFVYVPTYCAFRWHKHELSPAKVDDLVNATQDQQAHANRENTELAVAKHHFFYNETRHSNGLFSGGSQKLNNIRSGCPPLTLQAANSPLGNLLNKLYAMLNKHYQAVKMDELAQYRAVPIKPPSAQRTPGSSSDDSPGFYMDARRIANLSPGSRSITSSSSSSRYTTSSSESGTRSATSRGTACKRPLDNHEEIVKIFESVLRDERGRPLNLKKYLDDKVFDQFHDNIVILEDHIKNPSGSSGDASALSEHTSKNQPTPSGSKRKPDNPESDHNPRPKQKPKALKTRNHGIYDPS